MLLAAEQAAQVAQLRRRRRDPAMIEAPGGAVVAAASRSGCDRSRERWLERGGATRADLPLEQVIRGRG